MSTEPARAVPLFILPEIRKPLKIRKKIGDFVSKGEPYVTLYANDIEKLRAASVRVRGAYRFSSQKVEPPKHILGIVTADEIKMF